MDNFIFQSNASFSAILEKAKFEITKLEHVFNADNPLYRLFRVMLYSCLHLLFIRPSQQFFSYVEMGLPRLN